MIIGVPCIVDLLGVTNSVAERVVKFAPLAEAYLRNLKGDEWYDGFQAIFDTGNPALFVGDMFLVRKAESLLAMYYALPHLNIQFREDGGILSVEWTTADGVKTERRFVNMDAIAELQSHYLQQAKLLVDGDTRVEFLDTISNLVTGLETGSFYLGA